MGQTLHPAVVIEYLGDRDKTIAPNTLTKRVFTKNPAFSNLRAIVETDSDVLQFCESKPALFRRRPDLEAAMARKDILKDMSENLEDYVHLFYPAIKARLKSEGLLVVEQAEDDAKPTKRSAKKASKKSDTGGNDGEE